MAKTKDNKTAKKQDSTPQEPTLYFFYKGYLWLRKRIDDEERRHNEIFRLSEDEHDISDWGV